MTECQSEFTECSGYLSLIENTLLRVTVWRCRF